MSAWLEVAKRTPGKLTQVTQEYVWRPETADHKPFNVWVHIEIHELHDGRFEAIPDHEIKPANRIEPITPVAIGKTPEEALEACLAGFMKVMEDPEDVRWLPAKNSFMRQVLHEIHRSELGENT